MTDNQRKYLEYQENQRHNLAMEEMNASQIQETARSNLAKEAETARSNQVREAETHRINNWDNFFRGVDSLLKGTDIAVKHQGNTLKAIPDLVDAVLPG